MGDIPMNFLPTIIGLGLLYVGSGIVFGFRAVNELFAYYRSDHNSISMGIGPMGMILIGFAIFYFVFVR
jgi:hypothetical protein